MEVIDLRAELNAGDVFQAQNGAVGIGAENDIAEFLGREQAALRAHGVSELLALRGRFAADLAGGIDVVLRLQRGDDLRER